MNKIVSWLRNHKIITIIIIIFLIGGGYLIYKKNHSTSNIPQYNYAKAEKGDLIVTVSGSGQVSALNTVTLKPLVSGKVIYVNLKNGQEVKRGDILLKIDDTDVQNALTNAKINLEQAKLNLAKLESDIVLNNGTIESSKTKAENDLKLSYEKAVDNLPALFNDLSTVMDNDTLYNILYGKDLSSSLFNVDYYTQTLVLFNSSAIEFGDVAKLNYDKAKSNYNKALSIYRSQNLTYTSNYLDVENYVNLLYDASKTANDAVRVMLNLVQLCKNAMMAANLNYSSKIDDHLTTLNNLFNISNKIFTDVSSLKDDIQNNKENLANISLNIKNQEIAVQQAEQQVVDAQKNLENYAVVAPFDGILGNVANITKGDNINSGITLGILASKQYIVELSLPEVDAAKVKIGQRANITFDALENYTTTGQIIDIDTIGTISQGVVSYAVKVLLDTNDSKIKSGMSAAVEIITDIHPNVLLIPRSALKQQNGTHYVLVLKPDNTIFQKEVQIGLSNDSQIEIISGLNEGDQIVISAINSTSKTPSSQVNQRNFNIRLPGMF